MRRVAMFLFVHAPGWTPAWVLAWLLGKGIGASSWQRIE